MATYGERLDAALTLREVSRRALANHLGMSVQAVGAVIRGDSKRFNAENNALAAKFLRINPDWLATERGSMELAPPRDPGGIPSGALPYGGRNTVDAPVIGKSMGGVPDRIWDDQGRATGVTEEYAEVASTDAQCFLVRIEGDSMSPKYNEGDYALVEPNVPPEIEDDVLVRLHDGRTLLKRLLSQRGIIRLGSYNGDSTITLQPEDVVWMYYVPHPVPARRIRSRQ